MKTFWYTIDNTDTWRITDNEIIVVADNKKAAIKALKDAGYDNIISENLRELKTGVHIIQEQITE